MSVTIVPDVKAAVLAFLRDNADVTAVCPTSQIRGTMPSKADFSNGFYLTAQKVPGGSADLDIPRMSTTLEIRCYGPYPHDAMRLSRTVQAAFIPYDRRSFGFKYKGCHVYDVRMRVGHAEFPEPGYDGVGHWDMVRTVFEFYYWEHAV